MSRHASPEPPPSEVGRVIAGRYLLLRPLGDGGPGRVWLAHDRRQAREVVLEAVRAGCRVTPRPHGRPHTVTVHDAVEHEGRCWAVTEHVAGAVDLRQLVARRGPLAPAECARVGLAVLAALAAGHACGEPYRGVSPADVLLAPDRAGVPYGRILLTGHRAAGPEDDDGLFSLGRTLYYGVEGRDPFDPESGVPRPPVRAGALRPLLDRLLARDPALRITATEAEAELAWIVTPQTDADLRPGTDPASQPPWTAVAPPVPAPDAPAPAAHRRRRPLSRSLRAALAGALGVALALGGVWYALADRAAEGTGMPYGDAVGLVAPLADGDCVRADWPGGVRFSGTPRLILDAACRGGAPDGQVMAFVPASSPEEARELGPVRCEQRTQEVRGRLAGVRGVAVVPAGDGFEAAGRRTACLVLGAYGPVYGPLGRHREPGSVFADTATMQRRDCLDVRSAREVRLVSCAGPYDEQVLGFTRPAAGVTPAEAPTAADAACARDVPPRDYGFDPSLYEAGSRISPRAGKNGAHLAVCTVRRRNGGTMEGNGP
ncbi:septum formation family protein [Streptomyces flaveolus]|uniref:septum formation family protein n=1 Tax=Streptomyces flaveolus TaxID=67297 RepID=UPI00369351D4